MKLWLLGPNVGRPSVGVEHVDPWEPWYDKRFGLVVRAETEAEARRLASDTDDMSATKAAWLDPALATCVVLTPEGEPGVILEDRHHA